MATPSPTDVPTSAVVPVPDPRSGASGESPAPLTGQELADFVDQLTREEAARRWRDRLVAETTGSASSAPSTYARPTAQAAFVSTYTQPTAKAAFVSQDYGTR
jgi:hypothetical protein